MGTTTASPGEPELLHLFNQLRIVRYEDTEGIGNLGLWNTRLVRLCTQKL